MKGGFNDAFSTSSLPSDKYIALNNYEVDQSRLLTSTRILPNMVGGKKQKKRGTRKQRGGNLLTPFSFDAPVDSINAAAMLTGNTAKVSDFNIASQHKGNGIIKV